LDVDLIPEEGLPEVGDGDRLQQALNRLPEVFRLVVVMFYFEECSYREIADQLEVPIGTVMSRLARARGQLRSMMFDGEKELGEIPDDGRTPLAPREGGRDRIASRGA
jgi:RNA polymerase sigma-70 factor (ECF subfamily)